MSELKMSASSQTLETLKKKKMESQVTFHRENPNLQITTVKLDGLNYLEPKCCVLELFSWMHELKMSASSQTSETHKKKIGSQVTFHSENPNLQITTVKFDGLNYLS
jgi:hypothetical protein